MEQKEKQIQLCRRLRDMLDVFEANIIDEYNISLEDIYPDLYKKEN